MITSSQSLRNNHGGGSFHQGTTFHSLAQALRAVLKAMRSAPQVFSFGWGKTELQKIMVPHRRNGGIHRGNSLIFKMMYIYTSYRNVYDGKEWHI